MAGEAFPHFVSDSIVVQIGSSIAYECVSWHYFHTGTTRPSVLQKTKVAVVLLEECSRTLTQYNSLSDLPSLREINQSQLCALDLVNSSDACGGDSGGPIFTEDPATGLSTVHGVVSFGVSCGTALPSIYTRIAYYSDWIESIVWPN